MGIMAFGTRSFGLAFGVKPGSTVGWGGSDTLNKIGIKEELYKRNFKVIDRDQAKNVEEKYKLERDCLCRLLFNEYQCDDRRWNFSQYGWAL